ncbi:hypothetical protein BJX76DRAFT_357218 [Aspergillus varians]
MPPRLNLSIARPFLRRSLTTTHTRLNAGTPPNPPPQQPSAYKEGMSRYKLFASPFAKVFLGAVFTYQVIYWTWVKLEMEDVKVDKNQQLAALEKEARELTGATK